MNLTSVVADLWHRIKQEVLVSMSAQDFPTSHAIPVMNIKAIAFYHTCTMFKGMGCMIESTFSMILFFSYIRPH